MLTILVMDDEPAPRELFVEFLKAIFDDPVRILEASNPKEAHELLADVHTSDIGCIIADVQQRPFFKDWEFIDALLAKGEIPKAKIVAISALAQILDKEASTRGVVLLGKPLTFNEFQAAVRLACLWPNKPSA